MVDVHGQDPYQRVARVWRRIPRQVREPVVVAVLQRHTHGDFCRPIHARGPLLTHGSGLPREAADHWTTLEFPTRAELLVPKRQAAFAPETRWKYSNLAYTLAGMVVEAVSGESWATT